MHILYGRANGADINTTISMKKFISRGTMKNRSDIPELYKLCESIQELLKQLSDQELSQLINDCNVAETSNCWWIAHSEHNYLMTIND